MLRTINLRQIYCKIYSQKIDLRITATAMNVLLLCTFILSVCLIFMTICGFHHKFRQIIPSTITNKLCQNNVAQSALERNQFSIVIKVICLLLLSNSCLSTNLFNETFILENCDTYPTLHSEFILLHSEIHEDFNKQNANFLK